MSKSDKTKRITVRLIPMPEKLKSTISKHYFLDDYHAYIRFLIRRNIYNLTELGIISKNTSIAPVSQRVPSVPFKEKQLERITLRHELKLQKPIQLACQYYGMNARDIYIRYLVYRDLVDLVNEKIILKLPRLDKYDPLIDSSYLKGHNDEFI